MLSTLLEILHHDCLAVISTDGCVQLYSVFYPALAGWGPDVFTYSYHWWVVPIFATHVGAVLGAWLYYIAIGKAKAEFLYCINYCRAQLANRGT